MQRGIECHKMEIHALVSAAQRKDKELAKLKASVSALKTKCGELAESIDQLKKRDVEHRARTAQAGKLAVVHDKKLIARIVKLERVSDS